MRAEELEDQELVELDRDGGLIRVAGERAILLDSTAFGALRKDLVEQLGPTAARLMLTRLGFVQGWRLAAAMQTRRRWESDGAWGQAGGLALMLEGMYQLENGARDVLSRSGLIVSGSFEAEQHIAHLGRSDGCVCWTICGAMSGYLSRVLGQELFVLEERCLGRGDSVCHLLGRTREQWGDERADELAFFRSEGLDGWLDASLHTVIQTLRRAEKLLHERKRALSRVARTVEEPHGLVARSPAMRRLIDLARRVAVVDSTVLLTGESGTGKERIARLVHDESARATGPFIAVNCGAIAETLLESELFGHRRGSFTGAVADRPGLFEAANGGTLLLDEIGELSPAMQVKLLRALQEREVRRVGENCSRSFDVRVIAATNTDLSAAIASGSFRLDLYYRLNVVELHVPPLRERREDILPLARLLLAEAALRLRRPPTGLSREAADQLLRYDWPGNVRELENAMERAVALAQVSSTELDDLPEEVRRVTPRSLLGGPVRALQAVEREYILAALELNHGHHRRTAEQLGIGTATLYRKLRSYGVVHARRPPADGEPPPR